MKKAFKFVNHYQIIAFFCVLTLTAVLTWNVSDVSSQSVAAAESENSLPIREISPQGSGSLTRFGNIKVSAGDDQNAANSPRIALAADFDGDGVDDLVVAHLDRLVVQRGNINAFAPQTEEAWEAIRDGRFVAPFKRSTHSTRLPVAADFMFSGDFNRDTKLDVAFAARGDNFLYILDGDGTGSFQNLQRIETAGAITTLAAGDVNRADGLTDLIVGTRSEEGFGLQVFSGLGDITTSVPQFYSLPSPADAVTVGQFNENEFADFAIAAGREVFILSGGDTVDSSEIQRIPQTANIKSIIAGDFIPDRDNRTELALLTEDGNIHILKRGTLNTAPITRREYLAMQVREYQSKGYPIPERILRQLSGKDLSQPVMRRQYEDKLWSESDTEFAAAPNFSASPQTILTKGRISKNAAEDLIVLDSSSNRVLVLPFATKSVGAENQLTFSGKRQQVEYSVDDQPVAVLPMRLNQDGETDLLVIKQNQADYSAFVSAPQASFTVNSNADLPDSNVNDGICQASNGQCTLRAAIMQANKTPGNDSITINSGIGTITLNRGQPDDDAGGTNDEASGDLDITCVIDTGSFACKQPYTSNDNDLTITGAAGGTVIQAGTFSPGTQNPITTDRVFDIGQDGIYGGAFGGSTGIIVSLSNLTIQNGNVQEEAVVAGGGNYAFGGGIRYDGFGDSNTHGSLTLTNVTVNNNQSDNAGGGVYQVYGTFNTSGSTFSNNITNAGEGGGLFFGAATSNSNVSISSSTFSSNQARQGTVFGIFTANADGGGIRVNADPNTVAVTNTNFTNNIAQEDGGAIKTLGGAVTVTGGTMSGNTARRHGGVAFGDQDTAGTGRAFTFSGSTMIGNTANSDNANGGDGGAIFRDRGVLNITNTTIGGTGANQPNTATNGGGVAHAFTVDSAQGNTSNQTTITINGGTINGNIANSDGGGVYFNANLFDLTASTLNIGQTTATTLSSNKAKNNGGGINVSNAATANLKNITLRSNQANSDNSGGGDGGGLYQETVASTTNFTGTVTIGGSGFANSAVNGGGIRNNAGTINIPSGASITYNTATGTGGGISNLGTLSALASSTISNNTATGNGGGIFNSGTIGAITAPTLNNNSGATGGGIFNSSGALSITNGSVSNNTANSGKGGGIEHSGASASTVSGVTINGNTGSGINITGAGSLDVKTNTITNNTGDGITMTGTGVSSNFESNLINDNGELGIDLSDNGVTPNDVNDADSGPNNLQNFPVINYVKRGDGVANVTLNAPNGKYRIQYYKNATCDASGYGEGESLLTSQTVTIAAGNTLTFSSPALAFDSGMREQITATATSDPNGNGNFDDDGSTSEFSACRKVNTLPTISTLATSRQQGSAVSNSQIATVADPDQALNTLTVTVNGGASATSNGVTVSGIAIDANGKVTANVIADCTATNASFTLRVTDNATEFNEATLNVTVNANTAPTVGNYANLTVNAGTSGTVNTPDAAPADNGSVASVTAAASAGFTGTFSGNTTTGAITVNNAAPAGTYTVTVTITDNCGTTTQKTFTLTVNAIPVINAAAGITKLRGDQPTNVQIATVSDADQSAGSLTVTVNGGMSATVNNVTISNIAVSAAGAVTADIGVNCSSSTANFTLTVTDSNGASSQSMLTITVNANTQPTAGNYPNKTMGTTDSTTVTPDASPADNGTFTASVSANGGFTGMLAVDQTTGIVTITNANPAGMYTITVVFTDNCGATTNRTFTLTVNAPTAASVSITGRVKTAKGAGVANAQVTLINSQGVEFLIGRTNSFGYFNLREVRSGETYIIKVTSKRYTFTPLVINVVQDLSDIDFTAQSSE